MAFLPDASAYEAVSGQGEREVLSRYSKTNMVHIFVCTMDAPIEMSCSCLGGV